MIVLDEVAWMYVLYPSVVIADRSVPSYCSVLIHVFPPRPDESLPGSAGPDPPAPVAIR